MDASREGPPLLKEMEAFPVAFDGLHPTHLSRAPGRVNLIGEHTDYNGLPVFPMALGQEIRILFRPRDDDRVSVGNLDPEFEPRLFHLSPDIPVGPSGDWGNYLKAPCQALVRRLGLSRGMDALASSTLPVASGLSSSSALVIAMGRALLEANEATLPTLDLAEEMALAERYTGTQGGGMDQAISLGAREGHASRIEFDPLRMNETPIPTGWHFVVAHTLVRAEKSGPAQEAYNLRTRECREALGKMGQALAGRGGSPEAEESEDLSYPGLLDRIPIPELLGLAEECLDGVLLKRFRHVVAEAGRVFEAEKAMQRGDFLTFGILMDASHESLRKDYEVSSPELDELVGLAREAGAAGARLTGAGFGGCMVALVDPVRVERVMGALAKGYYGKRNAPDPLDSVLFLAEPSNGASAERI